MERVRFGVLGAAKIAVEKVIPALKASEGCEVVAIASRTAEKAARVARELAIPKAYSSYEALLAAPEVEAIYNPLPNHLHVPWSLRALRSGKHVLCEKPLALTIAEAHELVAARDETGLVVEEAFMWRAHPQWAEALNLVRAGRIGDLRAVQGSFSYFNRDPGNVRNVVDFGGGALLDIGCYPLTISRYLFGEEPRRVLASVERDPSFGTDRLSAAILEFPSGIATFMCSTQLVAYQRMQILGTIGRIELEIPFNAPPDRPTRIFVHDGTDLAGLDPTVATFPACDQYTLMGDLFARAVRDGRPAPVPLEDAVANTAALVALFRSAASGRFEEL